MKFIILVCLLFFSSCGFFCGELDDIHKAMIEEAQLKFVTYCEIENVPCEQYYLNINLFQEENPKLTSALHDVLYNKTEKSGWLSLHIYNKEGEFIITHHINGKRSIKAPSW